VPDFSLAPIQSLVAHGGIPGLIAETGSVFAGLAIFGYFIRRSAKKEKEREGGPNRK
jgi:FtsH-binding integral membrane protein